jgi:hypothetical protein
MPKKKTYFKQVPVRVAKRVAEVELRKQKSTRPSPALRSRSFRPVGAAYVA